MTIKNPAAHRACLVAVGAAHPEYSAEQVAAAATSLDAAGVTSLDSEGKFVLVSLSGEKLTSALAAAPNLVEPPKGNTDRERMARVRIREAKAGKTLAPTFDRAKYDAAVADIPARMPAGGDARKIQRAIVRERALREAGVTERNPRGGDQ